MSAQPLPAEHRPVLYGIDLDDDRPASVRAVDAPPPSGAPLDAPPPAFRIDHPLYEREDRAAWLADEFVAPGSIFHGKVHVPNEKSGPKKARQKAGTSAVTYSTFKGVIGHMLQLSAHVEEVCLPEERITQAILEGPHSLSHQKVEQGGQLLHRIFLSYWRAVATAYPDAWEDPHEHILWHPHGLNAFAKLGADVVEDQVAAYDIRQHYFDEVLTRIAGEVSLVKSEYADVPARDTTDHLYGLLDSARQATVRRGAGLAAVPDTVRSIDWGSATAPRSPWVSSSPFGLDS